MGREFGDMWGKFGENFHKNLGLFCGLSFLYLGREFKHNYFNLGFRFIGFEQGVQPWCLDNDGEAGQGSKSQPDARTLQDIYF